MKSKLKTKSIKRKRKKYASTLGWMDISAINNDYLELGGGTEHLVGIKIEPKNIFIEDTETQIMMVAKSKQVFSSNTKYSLYHPFVYRPINLDKHIQPLIEQLSKETKTEIMELIKDEIDLWTWYQSMNQELEFYVCIKGKPGRELDEAFEQLCNSYSYAGFNYTVLNKIDYDALIAYTFENPILNDYLFSRGLFEDYKEVNQDVESIK